MELERYHDLPTVCERETLVRGYADLFVQRTETYARQQEHSRSYYRVKQSDGTPTPLTPDTLRRHLRGEITIGLYSRTTDGSTRWSVIDSDTGLSPLLTVRSQLHAAGVPSYLELSRRGGHLWVFWREPLSPVTQHDLLSPYADGLELFPSDELPDGDGLGLVIRAPLGVHRLTGLRYPFVDAQLRPVSADPVEGQLAWLIHNVQRADPDRLRPLVPSGQSMIRARRDHDLYLRTERGPIAQWVEEHDIRSVVGEYVELNRSGVGRCPWPEHHQHADRHPSFQVFDSSQRWWCYTSRQGGDAFSFLCQYHHLAPAEMLKRLRQETP